MRRLTLDIRRPAASFFAILRSCDAIGDSLPNSLVIHPRCFKWCRLAAPNFGTAQTGDY